MFRRELQNKVNQLKQIKTETHEQFVIFQYQDQCNLKDNMHPVSSQLLCQVPQFS